MTVWSGRRVFVTGHTGFKGGWLSLWLHQLGARVFGYSLPPESEPNLFTVAGVDRVTTGASADIRDLGALQEALSSSKAEVVFHLAAQPLMLRGYADPVETYSTNIMGTVHVLEAAVQCDSVQAVVIVTSDKCYENREWVWGYRENDRLGGDEPYSSSKACAELLAQAYRRAFTGAGKRALLIATVRAGNVVGGGDWAQDRLLPDATRAFYAGQPLLIRRPDALRPWQHVLEPLSGYITLAERLLEGDASLAEAFNFGPPAAHTCSVRDIAEEAARLWGDGACCRVDDRAYPSEATRLGLDSTRAARLLGWRSRWELATTLKTTLDWYKAYYTGKDAGRMTLDQLCAYKDAL